MAYILCYEIMLKFFDYCANKATMQDNFNTER